MFVRRVIGKRILSLMCSMLLLFASVLGVVPVAHALGANLVANPSAETSSSNKPTSWASNKWGTNTATFTHTSGGHTGNYSLNTKVTKYSSGDAKWYFTPVTVKPSTSYTFSDWYQSGVKTSVDVEVTSTTGAVSYMWLGDPAASTAWKQNTYTFTTPANAAKVTVYHSIGAVGQLTVDDYSLAETNGTTTPTAPTVSVTAPAANATVSGTTTVSATASDAVSVKSVQFKVDGVNVGAADTTTPYSISWDSKTATNGAHTITAVATNSSDLTTTSSAIPVTVSNTATPTAPTTSVTAPTSGSSVSGAINLTANASDTAGIKNVQFQIDNQNVGSADTTSPYSVSWDSKTVANGTHTVRTIATNTSGLATTSAAVSFSVNNPTAPTVTVTSPTAGTTISATTALTADASGNPAVTSVQFKIDGNNVGVADTVAPYSVNWDSKAVANGTHTITAVATNSAAQTTASAPVTINVNNAVAPPANPTNLIPNPSFETANGTAPADWLSSSWGTNTSTFTYLTSGRTGSRSVETKTTAYTNGAANWYYNSVPVTAGKTYLFTNWYKSTVDTEVDAEVTMNDGTVQYFWLGSVPAASDWTQYKGYFTVPAGAKSVAIYQILAKTGTLTTDDYSLTEYTPVPYNRGIVTITFDDGWANQYTNARPILNGLGFKSTYYLISNELNTEFYMTNAQAKTLYAEGNEIGSHSLTHPDFTTLNATQLTNQFKNSQTKLQNLIGAPVTNFAYPFGAYNATTIAEGKKYYASQRSVDRGLNTRDNLDTTKLKIQEVDADTTNAQVQAWINDAIANKAWLILCYHEVANAPAVADDAQYTVKIADFNTQMNYLKSSGVSVQTLKSALTEVQAQ